MILNFKVLRHLDRIQELPILTKLNSNETKTKIAKKGCFKPNCSKIQWSESDIGTVVRPNKPWTKISLRLSSNTYTIRRSEILLANIATFFADCGSYLGLLLGASILSITDIL